MSSARAETLSTDNTQDLSLPHYFARELAETVSLQELIDVVAKWLPTFIDAERSSIALRLNPDDDFLTIMAMGGVLVIPTGTRLDLANSLVGEAFRTRKAIRIGDLDPSQGSEAQRLSEAGIRSTLIAPMISGGECMGTLNMGNVQPGSFTKRHQLMLEIIANLVGSTVRVHQLAKDAARRAHTDDLTGGLNRRAIFSYLDHVAADPDTATAALYIDLDGFKKVNDLLGHCRGDEVLRIIARRAADVVQDRAKLGRVGGDEFVVVIEDDPHGELARQLVDEIHAVCARPLKIDGQIFRLNASIGIASSVGITTGARLVSNADTAMYVAKREARLGMPRSTRLALTGS